MALPPTVGTVGLLFALCMIKLQSVVDSYVLTCCIIIHDFIFIFVMRACTTKTALLFVLTCCEGLTYYGQIACSYGQSVVDY